MSLPSLKLGISHLHLNLIQVPWADQVLPWLLLFSILPLCLTLCPLFQNPPCSVSYQGPSSGSFFSKTFTGVFTSQAFNIKWSLLELRHVTPVVWNKALIYSLSFCLTSWNTSIIKAKTLFGSCISSAHNSPCHTVDKSYQGCAGWSCISALAHCQVVSELRTFTVPTYPYFSNKKA